MNEKRVKKKLEKRERIRLYAMNEKNEREKRKFSIVSEV